MFKIKEGFYLFIIVALTATTVFLAYTKHWQPQHDTKVYYNRDEQLNNLIINTIGQAEHSVYFAVYTFTRADIKDALLAAKYRGLDVRGISDKKQYQEIPSQKQIINQLRAGGIPVCLQNHDAIMHLKVLVTDKQFISGSYNWTASATTSNDEVLEAGTSEPVRNQYEQLLLRLFQIYPAT